MTDAISEPEVHAFIDGELPPDRAEVVAAAIARDPLLATRVEGFRADKQALIAAFRSLENAPVPAALLRTARAGPSQPAAGSQSLQPRIPLFRSINSRHLEWGRRAALASAGALAAGLAVLALMPRKPTASAIDQALAARDNVSTPRTRLNGRDRADVQAAGQAMSGVLGNPTLVPDLTRAGFNLVSAEVYGENRPEAVQLRYEDAERRLFTLFIRPSLGPDAFDVTERGPVRICVWQNVDVTAVMTGELSTPELFRLASLAYSSLNL